MAITRNKETKRPAVEDGRPGIQQETHSEITPGVPQFSPPDPSLQGTAQAEESATATVWRRNQRITGLWSKNETRNTWISIGGVGWRKLANTSDSGITALNLLASQALQTGKNVDCREESDGMIHEIYLW